MQKIRIFVSSPADVSLERTRAKRVVDKLVIEFAGRVVLEPFFWEHEPMRATESFGSSGNIPLTSDFDIVVCILWSRLGSLLNDTFRRPDGSRYPSGTVFEMEVARDSYLKRKAPDLLVYRKTEELVLPLDNRELREQKLQQFEALELFIRDWFFDTDDTFKSALTSYRKVSQFEGLLEEHLRKLIGRKITGEGAAPATGALDRRVGFASYHGGNPFRGLEPFDFDDHRLFFGRSQAIEEVIEALARQARAGFPLVIVHGASGSGKSSLVRAGVAPVLMQPGVAEGIGLWRRAELRPSDASDGMFHALSTAMFDAAALPELAQAGWNAETLANTLAGEPEKAVAAIAIALRQAAADVQSDEALPEAPGSRLLLVLDQFEEVFSDERRIPEAERMRFEATLAALLRSGIVWALATMRSDRMARLQELESISANTRQHGQVSLMAPSETDLALMIRLPARAAGVDFEQLMPSGERLEDRLLREARAAPDGLPLLGFVLRELYENMPDGTPMLTFSALDALGGLEGAVAERAEIAYAGFRDALGPDGGPRAETALAKLVRLLTTLSEDATAPPLRRTAIIGQGEPDADRDALIARLVGQRLLTQGAAEGGGVAVHVSHEAIFRKWPRLAGLIKADEKFLETRRLAQGAAARWEARQRKPEFLWNRGALLADARFLLANAAALDPVEHEFAHASKASAGKRRMRAGALAAVATAILAGAFLLMPDKIVKTELSAEEKARVEEAARLREIAELEPQLATAVDGLEKAIWPDPELERDPGDERWSSEVESFPELEVAEIAARILSLDPAHHGAWRASLEAEIVAAAKDPEEADGRFDAVAARFEDWKAKGLPLDDLLDLKARIEWMRDNRSEATNLWAAYLRTPDIAPATRRRLYDVLTADRIANGNTREAATLLDAWLEFEDNALARTRRADIRLAAMDFTGARADIDQALAMQPNLSEAREMMPLIERAARYAGRISEATAAIDAAGARGDLPMRCLRARYLLAIDNFTAARDDLHEAAKGIRGRSMAIDILLAVAHTREGEKDNAADDVRILRSWTTERECNEYLDGNWTHLMELLDYDVRIVAAPEDTDLRLSRAVKLWFIGQEKLSLAEADALLETQPDRMDIKMLRIGSLLHLGQVELSLAECEACIRLSPDVANFYRFKAEALLQLEDRAAEALAAIDMACDLDPLNWFYHEIRSGCLDALGRSEAAATARKLSLRLKNQP